MPKKKPHPPLVSEQLRTIIENCGESRYAISKATGISQQTLSRFVNGERGLPMSTLDRLGEHLDLELRVREPKKGQK